MIIFIDLETTGLDPRSCSVLELAAVALDDDLKEVGCFETLVRPVTDGGEMAPVVVEMHTKSGLLAQIFKGSDGKVDGPITWETLEGPPRRFEAERAVLAWLDAILPPDTASKKPPLGGSSVHFDRSFLKEHMPDLERRFAYRNVDVSTFLECANRWSPELARAGIDPNGPKTPHRAMPDIRFSIDRLRAYKRELFDLWAGKAQQVEGASQR